MLNQKHEYVCDQHEHVTAIVTILRDGTERHWCWLCWKGLQYCINRFGAGWVRNLYGDIKEYKCPK
jgi:hypothetical protein